MLGICSGVVLPHPLNLLLLVGFCCCCRLWHKRQHLPVCMYIKAMAGPRAQSALDTAVNVLDTLPMHRCCLTMCRCCQRRHPPVNHREGVWLGHILQHPGGGLRPGPAAAVPYDGPQELCAAAPDFPGPQEGPAVTAAAAAAAARKACSNCSSSSSEKGMQYLQQRQRQQHLDECFFVVWWEANFL